MTAEIGIIMTHVKEGTFADYFGKPNTRCLTELQKNVLMIQGPEALSAYYDLTKQIYKPKEIQNNYTIKHVEKVLDLKQARFYKLHEIGYYFELLYVFKCIFCLFFHKKTLPRRKISLLTGKTTVFLQCDYVPVPILFSFLLIFCH